jgi:hypothetical protein
MPGMLCQLLLVDVLMCTAVGCQPHMIRWCGAGPAAFGGVAGKVQLLGHTSGCTQPNTLLGALHTCFPVDWLQTRHPCERSVQCYVCIGGTYV